MARAMKVTNHSSLPDKMAEQIIKTCVDSYELLYEKPDMPAVFIVCGSKAEIREIQAKHLPDEKINEDYDGVFLPPHTPSEPFIIAILTREGLQEGGRTVPYGS